MTSLILATGAISEKEAMDLMIKLVQTQLRALKVHGRFLQEVREGANAINVAGQGIGLKHVLTKKRVLMCQLKLTIKVVDKKVMRSVLTVKKVGIGHVIALNRGKQSLRRMKVASVAVATKDSSPTLIDFCIILI